ncbi:unnamed protein product [Cladocopium goreaui]|uniref:ABC transporter F family member 2 n=1 Tax=Cladocopium goreaui TaxID=2562237 RepID=A0A9P1CQB1_9DINO|nr:unnamed protein product [Cladocopium goreaui]
MEALAPQFRDSFLHVARFASSSATTQLIEASPITFLWDAQLSAEEGLSIAPNGLSGIAAKVLAVLLALWVFSVLTMGCAQCRRSGNCYESISVSSLYKGSVWSLCVNYLLLLPLHFMRSTENASGDEKTLYSPAEKELLTSKRRVHDTSVLNFLSVRRSMIYVSFLFLVIALLVQLSALPQAFQGRQIWIEKSDIEENGHVITYEDFVQASGKNWTTHSPEAFFQYSRLIYTGMFAKILRQTSTMDLFEACANAFCQISRCICLAWSLTCWPNFNQSYRGVLRALFFSVLAPLLATSIPSRLFIDWSVLDPVIRAYTGEISTHLATQKDFSVRRIMQLCKQIDTQGHEEAFAEALEACDLLTRAPKEHLKCCSFVDIVDFDFRPIHEACEDVREHARDPHSSKLYNVTLRAARMCHDNIYPNFKNGMEFGFQNSLEIFATAAPMAQHMAQSVSIAMGFVQGLRGFNAIVPAAIALSPALLRAALKVKNIVPQSTIPGMFVVALPLLYCPMAWGLYTIAFQLLGDFWMLMGLLVLAFSPMLYLALGAYFSITRPLTDKAITRVMISINIASQVVAVVGYVFIFTFAWKKYQLTMMEGEPGDKNTIERDAYRFVIQQVKVLQGTFWLELAGVCMANYFFTTLAGVDWMMLEIGKQRHYEILMKTAQDIHKLEGAKDVCYPPGLESEFERQEALKAAEERGHRKSAQKRQLRRKAGL